MRGTPIGVLATLLLLAGCGDRASLPDHASQGPDPQLSAPRKSWIPTVNVADATGWPENERPTAGEGLAVKAFATGLDHPRWMLVLPNGDVLVAEQRAGHLTLLRDDDGDGKADCADSECAKCSHPGTSTVAAGCGGDFCCAPANGKEETDGTCADNLDNDCNGLVDDGIPAVPCAPAGTPPGLVYGGTSQCRMGSQSCNQACIGFIGPTPEVSDSVDNNCNGVVDEGVDTIFKDGFE